MKRFMIAALAVAVLFSFAACDNSSSTPSTPDMSNIAYVEGALRNASSYYFDGDTPDAADFIFTGYDVEGNVVVADMASSLFGKGSVNAKDDTVTFGGVDKDSGSIVIEDVPVYTIDAIGVETVKTQNYFVNSNIEKIKDDYKVTVYALEDANDPKSAVVASKVLAASEYTIAYTADFTDKDGNAATKFTKAGDVTLTFTSVVKSANNQPIGDSADKKNEAEISVKQDYITSFTVAQSEDEDNYAVEGAIIKDASTYVEVTYTMASGVTGDESKTSGTSTATFATAVETGTDKFDSTKTYKVKVTATVNGKEESKEIQLTLVKNTLVSFEVSYSGDIENGTKITLDDLTISNLTWADEASKPEAVTATWLKEYLQMSVDGKVVTEYTVENLGANQKLPITFSLTSESGYADAKCETALKTKAEATVEDKEFDWRADALSFTSADWSAKSGTLTVYAPGDYNGTALTEATNYTVSVAAGDAGAYVVTVTGAADTEYADFSVTIPVPVGGLTGNSEE